VRSVEIFDQIVYSAIELRRGDGCISLGGRACRLALVVAVLALAGCDHSQADMAKCADYGFKPGSEGMATCQMSADQNRRAMGATMVAQNPYLRP
jgi:hypothetical protein